MKKLFYINESGHLNKIFPAVVMRKEKNTKLTTTYTHTYIGATTTHIHDKVRQERHTKNKIKHTYKKKNKLKHKLLDTDSRVIKKMRQKKEIEKIILKI